MIQDNFFRKSVGILLNVVLHVAYAVLKVVLAGKSDEIRESKHLEQPPPKPVASLTLATALDEKTPVEKLVSLVKNEDPLIRRALARNPTLPRDQLLLLAADADQRVSDEAKKIIAERQAA